MLKFKFILVSAALLILGFTACSGQDQKNLSTKNDNLSELATPPINLTLYKDAGTQIGEYIVEIFEDSKGNLWFGTMSKGVARYGANGGQDKALTYFTTENGLSGNAVVNIAEDKEGNLWFATHLGLSKYDGNTFTNFTEKDGLCHNRVANILIDKNDNMWLGAWGGVCRFDGTSFTDFPLPNPDIEVPDYQETENWVTEIMEDKEGNIWFGRSGYGACKYDGKTFTPFTKKEGLASNCVQAIQEDPQGNIWFGSRVAERDHPDPDKRTGEGGLNRYDGKKMIQYPELEGLHNNDVYNIYVEDTGGIWITATGFGLYQFDGESFHTYTVTDRMDLTHRFGLQCMLRDSKGTLWLGFSGGLFRLKDSSIINVTESGPW